jgi:hypothetical protein
VWERSAAVSEVEQCLALLLLGFFNKQQQFDFVTVRDPPPIFN